MNVLAKVGLVIWFTAASRTVSLPEVRLPAVIGTVTVGWTPLPSRKMLPSGRMKRQVGYWNDMPSGRLNWPRATSASTPALGRCPTTIIPGTWLKA